LYSFFNELNYVNQESCNWLKSIASCFYIN